MSELCLKFDCSIRVYQVHNKYDECSIRVITKMVTVLLEYIDLFNVFNQTLPIMLALCSMLLDTYYAQNYAGIIGASLS